MKFDAHAQLDGRTISLSTVVLSSLETRPSPSSCAIIITLTFEPYRSYGGCAEGLDDFRNFAHVIRGTTDVDRHGCSSNTVQSM